MTDGANAKKKTISEEQRLKMQEGRKRAMEERRKKKEEEKKAMDKLTPEQKRSLKKVEKDAKEKAKKAQLEAELQALQQQKDRIETMKTTMENRKKFRNKVRSKVEEKAEEPSDTDMEDLKDMEENIEMDITDQTEEHHEIIAHDNITKIDEPSPPKAEPEKPDKVKPVAKPKKTDKEIFDEGVKDILGKAKSEDTKKLLNHVTKKYDKSMSITDNLNQMAKEIKEMIRHNVKHIKKVDKVIEKEKPKDKVEMAPIEEVKKEYKYKSQMSSLMRIR